MISHLRALAAIQMVRFVLGLAIGTFLIGRSFVIPPERVSRLEPGDRTVFLVAGLAFVCLATLRGVQGASILRALRRPKERGEAAHPFRMVLALGLYLLVWASAGLATLAGIIYHFFVVPGINPEEAAEKVSFWLLPWISSAALFAASTLILLSNLFLRVRGARLRRLGTVLAIVDLVDLTGFPFTTGCGTYGLLVFRHPDTRDFLEGVFSREEQPLAARSAA